ncbi:hypothetical protein DE146DRAFT_637623 [Phaeosphaeria sp. MPI-PUGE-AT-0046c]|nr:hypothetical protein DE146DRAFT_637623 [Phaeosphaeria sp. MPI-PUGE-AT-0046c]
MRDIVRAKLNAVQAFTPPSRGGTQLHNPNDSAAQEEPQDDPPPSAQPSLSQSQRQNSGYDPSWSPPPQIISPPYQPNYFAPPQQYQPATQYYNNMPQGSPPLQGWNTPTQQHQEQRYLLHSTQPPHSPPNPTSHHSYHNNGYVSSSQSNYDPSISSTYSQSYQHSSPPPMTSSPPIIPSPQRTSSLYIPPHTQDPFYEQPSFQRSQTVPVQYWPRTQADHDCDMYKNT